MVAIDHINHFIPSLRPTDTGLKALDWMEENKLLHLPVVQGEEFLGLISEDTLEKALDPSVAIENFGLTPPTRFAGEQDHVFDVLQRFANSKLTCLAVLDSNKKYLGCITMYDLLPAVNEIADLNLPGGTIVISAKALELSFSEISRIIESNGAQIVHSFTKHRPEDPQTVHITLRLNTNELARVRAALERFEYTLVGSFSKDSAISDDYDRLDQLFKYINM